MHSINNRIKLSKSKLVALAQTCLNPAMGRPNFTGKRPQYSGDPVSTGTKRKLYVLLSTYTSGFCSFDISSAIFISNGHLSSLIRLVFALVFSRTVKHS